MCFRALNEFREFVSLSRPYYIFSLSSVVFLVVGLFFEINTKTDQKNIFFLNITHTKKKEKEKSNTNSPTFNTRKKKKIQTHRNAREISLVCRRALIFDGDIFITYYGET